MDPHRLVAGRQHSHLGIAELGGHGADDVKIVGDLAADRGHAARRLGGADALDENALPGVAGKGGLGRGPLQAEPDERQPDHRHSG